MGLFDYVRSSYPLGDDFSGQCQTKDIEDGIGGTMSQYWINPDGQLCLIDYSQTADLIELKEGDEGYQDGKLAFLNFQWIPNGKHGKVRAIDITEYVTICPAEWNGKWEDWPECKINFVNGKLRHFIIRSKGK